MTISNAPKQAVNRYIKTAIRNTPKTILKYLQWPVPSQMWTPMVSPVVSAVSGHLCGSFADKMASRKLLQITFCKLSISTFTQPNVILHKSVGSFKPSGPSGLNINISPKWKGQKSVQLTKDLFSHRN